MPNYHHSLGSGLTIGADAQHSVWEYQARERREREAMRREMTESERRYNTQITRGFEEELVKQEADEAEEDIYYLLS